MVMTDAMVMEALRFSISDTTGLLPQEMTEMARWFVANHSAWRLSRDDLRNSERRLASGSVLVVGEAGCGKTTFMAEEADHFLSSSDNFVTHVNFVDAEQISERTRDEDLLGRLGRFLTSQIEKNVGHYDYMFGTSLWDDYQAARIKEIVQHESGRYLGRTKGKYLKAIEQMSVNDILEEPELIQALKTFENQAPENLLGLRAIQRVEGPRRIVIMLDNLDTIGGRHAASCLESIIRTVKAKTLTYFALRDENEYAAAKITTFMSERVRVTVPSLPRVLEIRLNGVEMFAKSNGKPVPDGLKGTREMLVAAAAKIAEDRNAHRILTKWYNGNVRSLLVFVSINARRISAAEPGPQLHGVMLSSLIWNVDEQNDFLLSMLNPTDQSAIVTPFLFLKLRILSYLRKQPDNQCSKARIIQTFARYGVSASEVGAALDRLRTPTSVLGAFVRQANDDNGIPHLSLLPSGDLFISETASSVEFLGYQEEKRGGKQRFDPVARLHAASYFVSRRLLPAFRREHPYISARWQPTPSDQQRLQHYREDFGYSTGKWFISGLASSLSGYAEVNHMVRGPGSLEPRTGAPPQEIEAVRLLKETISEIRDMEKQLDDFLAFEFNRAE